jgi:hypothetical protein
MADTKITALTALTAIATGDILVVVDDPGGSPVTKKITIDNLLDALGSIGATQVDASATPVLKLTQSDVDEDYFDITGTSDTNVDRALVDAADFTTPGSVVGWLKIKVTDLQGTNPITDGDYYIPFYAAPSA